MKRLALLTVVCVGALAGTGRAEFILTFSQQGANVVASGTGSLNTTALSHIASGQINAQVWASAGLEQTGPVPTPFVDAYSGISGPSSFGPGGQVLASTGSGDTLGIAESQLPLPVPVIQLPQGYLSGSQLTSSSTWDNTTISALGLTPGTYTWSWGSGATADSFEIVIPSVSTPEPASLALLGIGAAGLLGYGWQRKRTPVLA
jgi:hypothetical protein